MLTVNSQTTHLVIVKRGLADRCREQGFAPSISNCDDSGMEPENVKETLWLNSNELLRKDNSPSWRFTFQSH